MVLLVKVNDGRETRQLQISPDAVTYDGLKEQVRSLFPSLSSSGVDFALQYQDDDGDIIVLSTDRELKTALAHLPPDSAWRVQVVPVRQRQKASLPRAAAWNPFGHHHHHHVVARPRHYHVVDPFKALFGTTSSLVDPFFTPGSSWGDLVRETDQEIEQMRKMHEEHVKQFEKQREKAEQQIQKTLERRQSLQPDGEGASSDSGAVAEKEGEVAEGGKPKWHMQQFGSWEPQVFESPYGKRTVVGPVGYHMYWGYSDPHKGEEEEKTMEREEAAAATSGGGEEPAKDEGAK